MALGGVDTGIMKPNDVDRARPTATGIGLNPSDMAVVIAIGPMRLVDAVFDVNSVSNRVKMQKTAMKKEHDICKTAGYREAMDDIKNGRVTTYDSVDDMFKKLGINV